MITDKKARDNQAKERLFEVKNLSKHFTTRSEGIFKQIFSEPQYLKAVDNVSFDIFRSEILGVAGQSGCGKSTLGELLVALQDSTSGDIIFEGSKLSNNDDMARFRQKCQVIFQDPYKALNPRFPVVRTVSEPLTIHDIGSQEDRNAKVKRALTDAGLTPPEKYLNKLPKELSGGERQRVCIARALVLDPDFLVADEPVSMLDVSVRTGILKLFKKLQNERNMSILYISHDLSTINYLADRTLIMYLGNIVEKGPTEQVIHDPAHPYTEALLSSVPDPDPEAVREGNNLKGDVPDAIDLPKGCRFHPRCDYATEKCTKSEPPLEQVQSGSEREAMCYHPVTNQ